MTDRSRSSACEAVLKYSAAAKSEKEAPIISTKEVCERIERGEHVILVDVRTVEEQAVSMLPGAVTKEVFERDMLQSLQGCAVESSQANAPLVVPYCTVGYRSGLYCRELADTHGLSNLRNGEGIIMWTFDGPGLVKPLKGLSSGCAPVLAQRAATTSSSASNCNGSFGRDCNENTAAATAHNADPEVLGKPNLSIPACATSDAWGADTAQVREVHVYGKPWDIAADGYSTVYFSTVGGVRRYLQEKINLKVCHTVAAWLFTFLLFYFFFTPACGLMYQCGCQVAPSKWAQVKTCNVFGGGNAPHRCPWCDCSGMACVFVASDRKTFREMPLLDLLPDGFVLTVIVVVFLQFSWRKASVIGERHNLKLHLITAAKACIAVLFFWVYCITFGGLFFAFSPDYPNFLGFHREL
eukprot:TRINITY_DN79992_c0_g1_i1.p1 TRINITY_DN79992_c0_g1~~TRINITY_DN79992_c0_g1_i1.p1  ORF type:complete len:420 (-),score=42.14 TRINITY_DN79992_c0_g1_i1:458-1690(-)